MEVNIKKYERYFLFIKEYKLVNNKDNDMNDNEEILFDFDLSKLKINDIKKENINEIKDNSKPNIIQSNDNALVINCPCCGTPNIIDENNQTFQCNICSSPLL